IVAQDVGPFGVLGFVLLIHGGKDDAALLVACVAPDALVEPLPDADGFGHQRHLARIAPGDAHPAPVAARLFLADPALFAQRHRHAAFGQFQRRRYADNAATDDDDID